MNSMIQDRFYDTNALNSCGVTYCKNGDLGGNRTRDNLIKSQAHPAIHNIDFTTDCFGSVVPLSNNSSALKAAETLEAYPAKGTVLKAWRKAEREEKRTEGT